MSVQGQKIRRIVVAGGGTAGWLVASALSQQMGEAIDITLVESASLGTVGVGEATIPPMRTFHRLLRVNEQDFMRATHATFKLGIQFENWRLNGESYFHSFGTTGKETLITEFIHFWLRGREMGLKTDFGDFCLEHRAALEGRFSLSGEHKLNYAYHLDATLYALYLRKICEANGVQRIEGNILEVQKEPASGAISGLLLESGQLVLGDLFIDCTGFKALLIEGALGVGYENWDRWLPCDRAVAIQTTSVGECKPYTRSIAHEAGWRWRIPLQHRVGNGLVYSSRFMSDELATERLLKEIDGDCISEPKYLRFATGRRKKFWEKNCVSIGLSSGFLEPLESTSIHMIMTAITRLLQLFPSDGISQSVVDEYNNQAISEMERVRDFIILHYKVTERTDSPFWNYCKDMSVPVELAHRINLFKESGKSFQVEGELFRLDSWMQVMLGQGLVPKAYHPIVKSMKVEDLKSFLTGLNAQIDRQVEVLPAHQDFVRQYCSIK